MNEFNQAAKQERALLRKAKQAGRSDEQEWPYAFPPTGENMIGYGIDEGCMRIQMFLNLGLDLIEFGSKGFPYFLHGV
jgi:hypothetical protein